MFGDQVRLILEIWRYVIEWDMSFSSTKIIHNDSNSFESSPSIVKHSPLSREVRIHVDSLHKGPVIMQHRFDDLYHKWKTHMGPASQIMKYTNMSNSHTLHNFPNLSNIGYQKTCVCKYYAKMVWKIWGIMMEKGNQHHNDVLTSVYPFNLSIPIFLWVGQFSTPSHRLIRLERVRIGSMEDRSIWKLMGLLTHYSRVNKIKYYGSDIYQ